MTALERQMAADAIALSREHADRADAAEARAVAAEAKLAKVRALAQEWATWRTPRDVDVLRCSEAILAITSTEEDRPRLTDSQCDRLRQMVTEYADGITAIRVALDMTEQVVLGDRAEVIARAREALKVLEGGEARGGCRR